MRAGTHYMLVQYVQMQQHSQLEGFRQVAHSCSGCAASRWTETKLHATAPRLSGEAQGVSHVLPAVRNRHLARNL